MGHPLEHEKPTNAVSLQKEALWLRAAYQSQAFDKEYRTKPKILPGGPAFKSNQKEVSSPITVMSLLSLFAHLTRQVSIAGWIPALGKIPMSFLSIGISGTPLQDYES